MLGTVVSSFSVAVLMAIPPSGIFSFRCDLFSSGAPPGAVGARDFGVDKNEGEAGGVPGPGGFWYGAK